MSDNRRSSSVPLIRPPRLKFNSVPEIRTHGPHSPSDSQPQKSNLKASNFDHEILVDPTPRSFSLEDLDDPALAYNPETLDSMLCDIVLKNVVTPMSGCDQYAKQAMSILTFPQPFLYSKEGQLFARFKASMVIVVTSLTKLSLIKNENGKSIIANNSTLTAILGTFTTALNLTMDLTKKFKWFVNFCKDDYSNWTTIFHPSLMREKIINPDLKIFTNLSTTPPGALLYEDAVKFGGEKLTFCWTYPEHFEVKPDIDFLSLPIESQLKLIQEVGHFGLNILYEFGYKMTASFNELAPEQTPQTKLLYRTIMKKLDEISGSIDLVRTMLLTANQDKIHLMSLALGFQHHAKVLHKQVLEIHKFVKKALDGTLDKKSRFCCGNTVDPKMLVQKLIGIENWSLELYMPLNFIKQELLNLKQDSQNDAATSSNVVENDTPVATLQETPVIPQDL